MRDSIGPSGPSTIRTGTGAPTGRQLHYPWNPGRVLLDCEHVQLQAVDLCIRCVLYSCAMMCFLGHIDTRSDGLQYRIIGQLLYLSLITNTSIYFSACAVEAQHDL
jgi:hypothetical protein